jgi:hypothetical protein
MKGNKNKGVTRRNFICGSAGAILASSALAAGGQKVIGQTAGKSVKVIEKSTALTSLTIEEGTSLAAPAGKSLTMTVDGIGTAMKPGTYKGDILLTVSDSFTLPPSSLGRSMKPQKFRAAILVEDGKYMPEKSVPAMVQGGKVTDKSAVGVSIAGSEEAFSGIIITGKSEYTIDEARINLEGEAFMDFIGQGSGIICTGDSRVTVNNSTVKMNGVTRCAVDVCGNSVATFNNCCISNDSPETTKMYPTWTFGLRGSNRATMLCDKGTVYYNNCHISGNGWGVLSVDGGERVRMYVKNSTIELTGPRARGYGAFSIGDCLISYDGCKLDVQGYPILMGNGEGICNAEITGGTVVNSTLYGAMIFRDIGSELKVNKGSVLNTASSSFVVKGSNTHVNIENSKLHPDNGVILQLMDNDGLDMRKGGTEFKIPVGEVDTPISGRDMTKADPKEDVFMTISSMEVTGNFFNSTTNLKANCREKGPMVPMNKLPGMPFIPELQDTSMGGGTGSAPGAAPGGAPAGAENFEDHQGVKNLDLKFSKAKVKGVISAATAAYKDGLTVIEPANNREISAVTQTAHEPVNNGVIVSFDKDSVWTVTGTSYLTSLTVAKGAVIKAPEGQTLTMTVNGEKKAIANGIYTGKIVITVE